jgi:hypothetical protein
MTRRILGVFAAFAAGTIVGHFAVPSAASHFTLPVFAAEAHKPIFMSRLYAGPDNQDRAEQTELVFSPGKPADAFKLMPVTGGEIHRTPGGTFEDWHPTAKRQYVITLAGQGEMEVAGGKKVLLQPGTIELIEDRTGKGHITRTTSSEDRVALHLYLADQNIQSPPAPAHE